MIFDFKGTRIGDSMAETIYELPREHGLRFPNTTRDGDSDDEISWHYDSDDEDDDTLSDTHSDLSKKESRLTPASISQENKASTKSSTSSVASTPDGTQTHTPNAGHQNAGQEPDTASKLIEAPIESMTSAHKVQCPNELPREHAYLDWACLELCGKTTERQPESYISGPDKTRVLLKEIEDNPASHATPVFMISGLGGVRSGRLLAERLHLGSLPGQQMCRVWTLVLDSQIGIQSLLPGECGSVVVAQDTYKVYGHVIGSNVLGHAHVVSLREVLGQIKIAFGTDLVYFPCRSSIPASPRLLSSDEDLLIQAPLSQRQTGFHVSNPQTFPSQKTIVQPEHTRFLHAQHVKQEADWPQLAQKLEHAKQREQLRQLHLQQIRQLHLQQIQKLQLQEAQQLQKLKKDQKLQLLFPYSQVQPVAGLSRQTFASFCDTETTTDAYNPGRIPLSSPQGVDSTAYAPWDPEEVSILGPLYSDWDSMGGAEARPVESSSEEDLAPPFGLLAPAATGGGPDEKKEKKKRKAGDRSRYSNKRMRYSSPQDRLVLQGQR
ncbi:hypothetical protein CcaCcLH18_13099 [Colletotrichum camelliae]|nr:hypothetical protein CcaCcLH18_13099 [Colletotrichum camelliae]